MVVGLFRLLGPLQILQQVPQVHPVEGFGRFALHRPLQVLKRWGGVATVVLQQPQEVMGCSVGGIRGQDRPVDPTGLGPMTLLMQRHRRGQGIAHARSLAALGIRRHPSPAW